MKKFSRLLSALLAVVLVLGLVPMGQLTAVAADVPTFSLNVVSETNSEAKVSINLDSGSFLAADVSIVLKSSNLTCTNVIESDELFDFETAASRKGNACVSATFKDTLKCSVATTAPFSQKAPLFVYTLKKATSTKIVKTDIELKCTSFKDGNNNVVTPKLVNNLRTSANPLAAPTVTATNVASSGKIKLSWNAVSGAESYKVYRATSKSGTYSLMKTTTSTSYTNTSAVAGKSYYYKVCAVEKDGTLGNYSSIVTRCCDCAKPVITLSSVASTGKVKISWKAVSGATAYKVYRASSKTGTYSLVKTTTNLSYTNTSAKAGETYYYKVKAIVEGKSSADSAFSTAKYRTTDLAAPVVSVALTSKGNPKLSWNAVSGATSYKVYRATSQNGTYKRISTTTNTSLTNTSVNANTIYYYKVIAVHSNTSANSAYSNIVNIKTK